MCNKFPDHHSFSSLSSFEECPMGYYLQYIQKVPRMNNGFSDFGTYCHRLLERWAKGDIPSIALAEEYEDGYDDAVVSPFPPFPKGMPQKYFESGLDYFKEFDGFGGAEILDVERPFEFLVDGRKFVGVVDLVLREKDGSIIIIDHKSKSAKQMAKDMPTYRRQLYTYARFVYEKYGVFPKKIGFNLFREHGQMVWEEFDPEKYDETMVWISSVIRRIEAECLASDVGDVKMDWEPEPVRRDFFCRFVCSVLDHCPLRYEILYGGGKEDDA